MVFPACSRARRVACRRHVKEGRVPVHLQHQSRLTARPWIVALLPALTCAFTLWLAASPQASANGTAITEVFKGEQGPYRITVRAVNAQLLRGNTHLSMLLYDTATDRLVTDAAITVSAQAPDGGGFGPLDTFHAFTTPDYYDANFTVGVLGSWQFTVDVKGKQGEAQFTFPLRVEEPVVNWSLVGGLMTVALIALPAVFLLMRALRKGKEKPKPTSSEVG